MTPTLEPAVGQVYELPGGRVYAIVSIERQGDMVWYYVNARDWLSPRALSAATYLGTLDELREHHALRRDAELWRTQVRTDNTKVIERLERENAELRAALKEVIAIRYAAGDQPELTISVCMKALTPTPHE